MGSGLTYKRSWRS